MSEDTRHSRLLARARDKRTGEWEAELADIRAARGDFPGLDYFLSLHAEGPSPEKIEERTGMPPVALLCLQAPIEIFLAQGFFPVKILGGSHGCANLTSPKLPALMCPTLKAVLGETELDPRLPRIPWVLPLTCDWMVKFKETRALFGDFPGPVHLLEVPRLRESAETGDRWVREVSKLSGFLAKIGGKKLNAKNLSKAMGTMEEARKAQAELAVLRRKGLVPARVHALIQGAFFFDRAENWTRSVNLVIGAVRKKAGNGDAPNETGRENPVFLSGSPVFFPNFKILKLLETAKLNVLADDLCSSERLFPRHVAVTDRTVEGMTRALADAYHRGCLCPVFAENAHRASVIKEAQNEAGVRGVVFHLLKGCHPYDLDSFSLEEALRGWGLKFLKIETDYSAEDGQNLLTRLEAFRPTLNVEKRTAK
ncbi:MAG: 2-hydroxyacyl-CoA dehydratase family protein [Deltaproteobacteria bacterium]|jgi:benzoyl-CoA reductase/2-hydroxyglutaryl-CoA dehydratase subunit BcrC/BadD/HgdB|nr:2-hydroxyacyl-CoA dehydratase family protein [Deltaproteobacteria bacterium]